MDHSGQDRDPPIGPPSSEIGPQRAALGPIRGQTQRSSEQRNRSPAGSPQQRNRTTAGSTRFHRALRPAAHGAATSEFGPPSGPLSSEIGPQRRGTRFTQQPPRAKPAATQHQPSSHEIGPQRAALGTAVQRRRSTQRSTPAAKSHHSGEDAPSQQPRRQQVRNLASSSFRSPIGPQRAGPRTTHRSTEQRNRTTAGRTSSTSSQGRPQPSSRQDPTGRSLVCLLFTSCRAL